MIKGFHNNIMSRTPFSLAGKNVTGTEISNSSRVFLECHHEVFQSRN